MRLRVLDSGHRLRGRTFFWLMRAVAGTEDAVAKTSLYRPSFFGRALLRFIRSAMRGQSDWSAGGRELFAALVSRLNGCPFCVSVHVGITALALNPTITAEQLDHWRDIGCGRRSRQRSRSWRRSRFIPIKSASPMYSPCAPPGFPKRRSLTHCTSASCSMWSTACSILSATIGEMKPTPSRVRQF
jgi:AhpD family alkylhydroperoxidase